MKIDELYFGYTPYSKYTLNEDENTEVNIDAYFKLTKEAADNKNGTKGFAEELEDLLNTPHVADSMASELAAEKEHGDLATKQAIINNQQIKDLKISADALSRENKHMADIIVQQETIINKQKEENSRLKANQKEVSAESQNQTTNNEPVNTDDLMSFDGLNK